MYIRVKVKANARKEEFRQTKEDHFEISVKEKAERNMANKRVIEIISSFFSVPLGKVRIVNGHQSPTKLMIVEM
ncbi:MAG TPA: DUF167 domain-containing protein [Candidatus Paceibacterota bacterium]|nr:DUF167 domain-containing protein [Candidatus Paceibacterota bacterium]HPT18350.1 DUF167 domain-containing protein [Candidatus Paceibacterota bacterium]